MPKLIRCLCLSLCTLVLTIGCAPASLTMETKTPVVVEVTGEATPLPPPTLRVSMSSSTDPALQGAVERAATLVGVQVEIMFMGPPMPNRGYCPTIVDWDISEVDVYLMESTSALHMFDRYAFVPVPEEIVDKYLESMFGPGRQAYTGVDGKLYGLAQGTMPVMVVYNPETVAKLGIDLPESMRIEEMIEIVAAARDQFGDRGRIAISPHAGVAVALMDAMIGKDFSEDVLGAQDLVQRISGVEQLVDTFFREASSPWESTAAIAQGFCQGQVAWTIQNSEFLPMLARCQEDVPVATARLPEIESMGSMAMGRGWTVPAGAEHPELAWKLIAALTEDPVVLRWSLSIGMLPVSKLGFNQLVKDSDLAKSVLPRSLVEREEELAKLETHAAESTFWRVPTYVNIQVYNEKLLPAGDDLIGQLAAGKMTVREATTEWTRLAEEAIKR